MSRRMLFPLPFGERTKVRGRLKLSKQDFRQIIKDQFWRRTNFFNRHHPAKVSMEDEPELV